MDFKNDGSFLQQFLQMQGAEGAPPPPSAPPPPPPDEYGQADPYQQYNAYGYGMYGGMGGYGSWGNVPAHPMMHHTQQMINQPPPPPQNQSAIQPSRSIWVGNLPPQCTEGELYEAFGDFGEIETVKLISQKGCAFVVYADIEAATMCFRRGRSKNIRGYDLKIGWGKLDPPKPPPDPGNACRNLWVGNITHEVIESDIRSLFGKYGNIEQIKILVDKNCAFVNFHTTEQAVKARQMLQGAMIRGRSIRINYGKDPGPSTLSLPALTHSSSSSHSSSNMGSRQEGTPEPMLPLLVPMKEGPILPPPAPPPADPELKNVIDKLAEFVVRNGFDFEEKVKASKRGQPKFDFLFGGEHEDYYVFKVQTLRYAAAMRQQATQSATASTSLPATQSSLSPPPPPPPSSLPPPPPHSSHPNPPPSGSWQSVSGEGWGHGAAAPSPWNDVPTFSPEEETQMQEILENLSGTKESIKSGKDWILERPEKISCVFQRMYEHIASASCGSMKKLHVIYLINDVCAYSSKSRPSPDVLDGVCAYLASCLHVLFLKAIEGQTQEMRTKITNVLGLWVRRGIYDAATVAAIQNALGVAEDEAVKEPEAKRQRRE